MDIAKISRISLTLALSFLAVIAARSNDKKRSTSSVAYYQTCSGSGWHSVTLDGNYFDDIAVTSQAALRLNDASMRVLWKTQATTTQVKYSCP